MVKLKCYGTAYLGISNVMIDQCSPQFGLGSNPVWITKVSLQELQPEVIDGPITDSLLASCGCLFRQC